MIRIVAGRWRGRTLQVPQSGTRPTSDRLRETIFNVLQHDPDLALTFEGLSVLDAFCGTGALGFEALSRGASALSLMDAAAGAVQAARGNAEQLQALKQTKIYHRDARKPGAAPRGLEESVHGLIFLDPPYHQNLAMPALAALCEYGWANTGAIVVIETAKDEIPPESCPLGRWQWQRHRLLQVGPATVSLGWVSAR